MNSPFYSLSSAFYKLIFTDDGGVEQLLVADREPGNLPQRMFLVRYVIGEGGGGETRRPVFKDELVGYDCESKLTYQREKLDLDSLQSILESSMYGSPEAKLSRVIIENQFTKEKRPVKVIVSESLVAKLGNLSGIGLRTGVLGQGV